MSTDRELTGHSAMRNWIFMQSPRTALQNVCLLQREKSKFPLGEPGSNQSEHQAGWGKLPSCPLEGDSERNTVILCVIMWHPWPRRTASNYKEPSAKPNLKEVLKKKKKDSFVKFQNVKSMSWKSREDSGNIPDWRRPKRHENSIWYVILGLDSFALSDIIETTEEIRRGWMNEMVAIRHG